MGDIQSPRASYIDMFIHELIQCIVLFILILSHLRHSFTGKAPSSAVERSVMPSSINPRSPGYWNMATTPVQPLTHQALTQKTNRSIETLWMILWTTLYVQGSWCSTRGTARHTPCNVHPRPWSKLLRPCSVSASVPPPGLESQHKRGRTSGTGHDGWLMGKTIL